MLHYEFTFSFLCKAYGTQFNLTVLKAITPSFIPLGFHHPETGNSLCLLYGPVRQDIANGRKEDTGNGLIEHHTTKVSREYRI